MRYFQLSMMLLTVLACACSSDPVRPSQAPLPEWTKDAARTVDNGYIVFVASAEDRSMDRAQFKAEGQALQDMANECSFIPLGARVEDRAKMSEASLNTAFVKVAIEIESCEEAKKAVDPERVRKLANVPMAEHIKKYQAMINEPVDLEQVAEADTDDDGNTLNAPERPAALANEPVQTRFRFFVMREQVAYAKQTVILAPPNAYAAGSPETQTYMTRISAPSDHLAQYEAAHPLERTSNATWTHYQKRAGAITRARRSGADPIQKAAREHERPNDQKEKQDRPRGRRRHRR